MFTEIRKSYDWEKYLGKDNWLDIHRDATVVDLHTHPSLKMRFTIRHHVAARRFRTAPRVSPTSLRTAFDRLKAGGVNVLFSGLVASERQFAEDMKGSTIDGQLLKANEFFKRRNVSPFERILKQLKRTEKKVEDYNNSLLRKNDPDRYPMVEIARKFSDLEKVLKRGSIAMLHSLEGAHALDDDTIVKIQAGRENYEADRGSEADVERCILQNIETLADKGLAYMTLGHFYPNEVAATTFSYPQRVAAQVRDNRWKWAWRDPTLGLTKVGEAAVETMLDKGMLIDVTHTTRKTREHVYRIVKAKGKSDAVLASHVGAFSLNPDLYNLDDDEIRWFGENGGVIGVMFSNYWLNGHDGAQLGINYISNTIRHFVEVGGVDVVGLGSDFDGLSDPPDDLADSSEMYRITQRLWVAKYLAEFAPLRHYQIDKILGGNAMRVLKNGWG